MAVGCTASLQLSTLDIIQYTVELHYFHTECDILNKYELDNKVYKNTVI